MVNLRKELNKIKKEKLIDIILDVADINYENGNITPIEHLIAKILIEKLKINKDNLNEKIEDIRDTYGYDITEIVENLIN